MPKEYDPQLLSSEDLTIEDMEASPMDFGVYRRINKSEQTTRDAADHTLDVEGSDR